MSAGGGRRRNISRSASFPKARPATARVPTSVVEADEKWRPLHTAIEGLPPRCREVFLLYLLESLSLGEIAQRLGVSQNMAQKHMRLAVRRCLEALR
ncbi:RNA polymerase sigma factor [Methylosinus sp. Sm6]|uniref:RNA polymerase sigma factor n=1 Tax=Methylosinus sp. Sm6 TaxID=2866948 RepID=UPI002101F597|nr:sigma-70 family RNA polymerase sigma factor [Methylosinus sp. Sm6]